MSAYDPERTWAPQFCCGICGQTLLVALVIVVVGGLLVTEYLREGIAIKILLAVISFAPARAKETSPSAAAYAKAEHAVTSVHSGTSAFALWLEKSGGTSNLPVCRSYLQRQSFTTPVCWGLRPSMLASPDRAMRR